MLGWVQGAWCDPADLDRLFRLRWHAPRSARGGCVRFRHWRLYAERGLTGERAAVWVHGETLTVEYATETLAQYRVALESDGRRLREVTDPRFFATGARLTAAVLGAAGGDDVAPGAAARSLSATAETHRQGLAGVTPRAGSRERLRLISLPWHHDREAWAANEPADYQSIGPRTLTGPERTPAPRGFRGRCG